MPQLPSSEELQVTAPAGGGAPVLERHDVPHVVKEVGTCDDGVVVESEMDQNDEVGTNKGRAQEI